MLPVAACFDTGDEMRRQGESDGGSTSLKKEGNGEGE
jgi:hypothetical protein